MPPSFYTADDGELDQYLDLGLLCVHAVQGNAEKVREILSKNVVNPLDINDVYTLFTCLHFALLTSLVLCCVIVRADISHLRH